MELAQLTPGPGFDPARCFLYYAQRVVTEPRLRQLIVAGIKSRILSRQGPIGCEPPTLPDKDAALRSLNEHGYAPLQAILSDTQLKNIHAFLHDKQLVDYHDPGRVFTLENPPDGVRLADYRLRDIVDCPHILELMNSPALLHLAAQYIGCKPTISALGLRWSFPCSVAGTGLQAFHRDPDDWRFVKVFVYLTDVDAESGPHVYVRGSHQTRAAMRLRPYSDEEMGHAYKPQQLITVTGPRGFGFAADTYGIHKGMVPTRHPRLLLQIQYSLLPVYAYRYAPEPYRGSLRLDSYINRLILR